MLKKEHQNQAVKEHIRCIESKVAKSTHASFFLKENV